MCGSYLVDVKRHSQLLVLKAAQCWPLVVLAGIYIHCPAMWIINAVYSIPKAQICGQKTSLHIVCIFCLWFAFPDSEKVNEEKARREKDVVIMTQGYIVVMHKTTTNTNRHVAACNLLLVCLLFIVVFILMLKVTAVWGSNHMFTQILKFRQDSRQASSVPSSFTTRPSALSFCRMYECPYKMTCCTTGHQCCSRYYFIMMHYINAEWREMVHLHTTTETEIFLHCFICIFLFEVVSCCTTCNTVVLINTTHVAFCTGIVCEITLLYQKKAPWSAVKLNSVHRSVSITEAQCGRKFSKLEIVA